MISTLFCVILDGIMDGFEIIAVGLSSPPGHRRQKNRIIIVIKLGLNGAKLILHSSDKKF